MRQAYGYDVKAASLEASIDCSVDVNGDPCPSMARQAFRDECDINTIVRLFGLTGQLPDDVRAPVYADFEGIFDYQSALNAVIAAEDAFMSMPADVRSRFHNDPQAFVEFCSDDRNHEEARRMGLTVSPPTEVVPKAEVDALRASMAIPKAGQAYATDPNL